MGRVLTALRWGFVTKWVPDEFLCQVLDVGIGGGAFCDAGAEQGVDVNEYAIQWLKKHRDVCLWDTEPVPVMTFWDSIEHIADPDVYLGRAEKWVFISTPIYKSREDCLVSKHYKPGEHLWYFTDRGLMRFMVDRGFELTDSNRLEDDAGREGIGSYAFKRR